MDTCLFSSLVVLGVGSFFALLLNVGSYRANEKPPAPITNHQFFPSPSPVPLPLPLPLLIHYSLPLLCSPLFASP